MIGERVIEQKPIPLSKVKDLLAGRKKQKDLTYEQDITFKYAKKFARLSPAQIKKATKELQGIEALTPELVVKIVDLLPDKKETLQMLFTKEMHLEEAALQKILEIVKKYKK